MTATSSNPVPIFIVRLRTQPGVNPVRALRELLKAAGRRYGLRAIEVREEVGEYDAHQTENFYPWLRQAGVLCVLFRLCVVAVVFAIRAEAKAAIHSIPDKAELVAELDNVLSIFGEDVGVANDPPRELMSNTALSCENMMSAYFKGICFCFPSGSQHKYLTRSSFAELKEINLGGKSHAEYGSDIQRWGSSRIFPFDPNLHFLQGGHFFVVEDDFEFWRPGEDMSALDISSIKDLFSGGPNKASGDRHEQNSGNSKSFGERRQLAGIFGKQAFIVMLALIGVVLPFIGWNEIFERREASGFAFLLGGYILMLSAAILTFG
jgi:hypothetical protein